jgi:hypothetical protein
MKSSNPKGKFSERMIQVRRSVVLHAIEKFASDDVLRKTMSKRRSNFSDQALIDDFMQFDQPYHKVKRDVHYLKALRVTKELFRPSHKLRPIHFPDLRYYPWALNTSAEAPWSYESGVTDIIRQKQAEGMISDGRRSFHNLYDEIFIRNRLLIHEIKDLYSKFWTSYDQPKPYEFVNLHARSHVVDQDEPDKIRAVFGVTKLLLMAEQHFIYPLQEQYLNTKVDSPMLWGNEMIKGGWLKLYNKYYSSSKFNTVLSIDWKQFDKRALHEVIDDVHAIWRSYFDFEHGYVPTSEYPNSYTEPNRIENLWRWMCYSIKHTPICLPDGRLFSWRFNGIASGFQQTQLLDSFVNTIMILTCLSEDGINIESKDFLIKVQGDDSLVALPEHRFQQHGQLFLKRLASSALTRFNAILNTKKSQISGDLNDIKVLGYANRLGMPYREDEDLLAHLLFPERSFGLPELAASCVGICWATLGCSQIVYFICKDSHSFLVDKLGITPKAHAFEWLVRMGAVSLSEFNIERFPSFDEVFSTRYSVSTRTEKMKERLYPTKPESAGGFMFLPY